MCLYSFTHSTIRHSTVHLNDKRCVRRRRRRRHRQNDQIQPWCRCYTSVLAEQNTCARARTTNNKRQLAVAWRAVRISLCRLGARKASEILAELLARFKSLAAALVIKYVNQSRRGRAMTDWRTDAMRTRRHEVLPRWPRTHVFTAGVCYVSVACTACCRVVMIKHEQRITPLHILSN